MPSCTHTVTCTTRTHGTMVHLALPQPNRADYTPQTRLTLTRVSGRRCFIKAAYYFITVVMRSCSPRVSYVCLVPARIPVLSTPHSLIDQIIMTAQVLSFKPVLVCVHAIVYSGPSGQNLMLTVCRICNYLVFDPCTGREYLVYQSV